jgi:methionyl aminopeptidase
MTVESEEDLEGLKKCGRVVSETLAAMGTYMEPGMTTAELDAYGRELLEREGARSAPELTYDFPGATCISINEVCAHGIPGDQVIQAGDLVNIDVSAEKNGFVTDTGGSFIVPPARADHEALCKATKIARDKAIRAVKGGSKLNVIGKTVEQVARKGGYTIIENLASHGVGRSLHEEPGTIPGYYDPSDKRRLWYGAVITIEPFLSTGATEATELEDGWSLTTPPGVFAAQYEHTLVVTKRGAIIVT